MKYPEVLKKINLEVLNRGGRAYIVGGSVRDSLLNLEPKDFDVEVYGLSVEELKDVLQPFGETKEVGESFGVLKVKIGNEEFDFSLPRKDNKVNPGHKGFTVEIDPYLSILEASKRRDFTINSVMFDIATNKYIDLHNGKEDIQSKTLRHISPAFSEDPLRVLRAMQFAGRFGYTLHKDTASLCQALITEYIALAKERVWGEWYKWAVKSTEPSKGLEALLDSGWMKLYSELWATTRIPQDPEWHPEGDVFKHTCYTVDYAVEIANRENLNEQDRAVLVFAALCHDFGKIVTTEVKHGRIKSPRHDKEGETIAVKFLQDIHAPTYILEAVPILVAEHMIHVSGELTAKTIRRLAVKLDNKTTIQMLSYLIEADHCGRPPLPKKHPCPELDVLAKALQVTNSKPVSFISGRHLIDLGFKPGKQIGEILQTCYNLQLDGEISSLQEAITYVQKHFLSEVSGV